MAQSQTGVHLEVAYPERLSRLHLLVRTFLGWLYVGIPHGIALSVFGLVATLCYVVAFVAILWTGRYPRSLFDIALAYQRWALRVNVYLTFMTDRYPPFALSVPDYPDRVSRGSALLRFLLGWLYAGIPHAVVLTVYAFVLSLALIVAWFAVLCRGRFPQGIFHWTVAY